MAELRQASLRLVNRWRQVLRSLGRQSWADTWKPGYQHAGEKRGVAGLLLGRTERAARAAELQLCAQAR